MSQRLHRIFMESIPGSRHAGPVKPGWYGGSHSTNAPIYNRVQLKADAQEFTAAEAVELITDFRSAGYGCSAEPPIVVTY